jgi:hypothetical protein
MTIYLLDSSVIIDILIRIRNRIGHGRQPSRPSLRLPPDCVDAAFNLARGEVPALIVEAPDAPIAAPAASAAVSDRAPAYLLSRVRGAGSRKKNLINRVLKNQLSTQRYVLSPV